MGNGYQKFSVSIKGDKLLMHNGQTADPLNKYARALKEVTSDRQRKKTDEGIAAMASIEFEAGLYLDPKERVIIPSRVLESHLSEAARKSKEGKLALAGMFVDTDGLLEYAGGPLSLKKLTASPNHRWTTGVTVGTATVMRTRPLFADWSTNFQVSILSEMVTPSMLKTWLNNGGNFIGLCDYRPRYGRYSVTSIEEI